MMRRQVLSFDQELVGLMYQATFNSSAPLPSSRLSLDLGLIRFCPLL